MDATPPPASSPAVVPGARAAPLLPRLLAITDLTRLSSAELVQRAAALAQGARPGSVAIVLRDHSESVRVRLALGRQLRELTSRAGQALWVADRLDLALVLRADALHLGEASVTPRDARSLLGNERLLSRAWHDERVDAAELAGTDAVLLSPVMESRKGRPALGLRGLGDFAEALRAAPHPPRLYALGGVTAESAAACVAAGAWGVAAIGAAFSPQATELLEALEIRR
jgi:thiamine-phosphate pyrophosphorylase